MLDLQVRLDRIAKSGKVHPRAVLELVVKKMEGARSVEALLDSSISDDNALTGARAIALSLLFDGLISDVSQPDLAELFDKPLPVVRNLINRISTLVEQDSAMRGKIQKMRDRLLAPAAEPAVARADAPSPASAPIADAVTLDTTRQVEVPAHGDRIEPLAIAYDARVTDAMVFQAVAEVLTISEVHLRSESRVSQEAVDARKFLSLFLWAACGYSDEKIGALLKRPTADVRQWRTIADGHLRLSAQWQEVAVRIWGQIMEQVGGAVARPPAPTPAETPETAKLVLADARPAVVLARDATPAPIAIPPSRGRNLGPAHAASRERDARTRTARHARVMEILQERGVIRPGELAKVLGISHTTLCRDMENFLAFKDGQVIVNGERKARRYRLVGWVASATSAPAESQQSWGDPDCGPGGALGPAQQRPATPLAVPVVPARVATPVPVPAPVAPAVDVLPAEIVSRPSAPRMDLRVLQENEQPRLDRPLASMEPETRDWHVAFKKSPVIDADEADSELKRLDDALCLLFAEAGRHAETRRSRGRKNAPAQLTISLIGEYMNRLRTILVRVAEIRMSVAAPEKGERKPRGKRGKMRRSRSQY